MSDCDPMDCILPGSSVHGILQARILKWVAIPFSRGIFLIQGLNPGLSPALQADSLPSEQPDTQGECHVNIKGDASISHGMQKIASKAPEAGSGA